MCSVKGKLVRTCVKTGAAAPLLTIDFQARGVSAALLLWEASAAAAGDKASHTRIKGAVSPDVASLSHRERREKGRGTSAENGKRFHFPYEIAMHRRCLASTFICRRRF